MILNGAGREARRPAFRLTQGRGRLTRKWRARSRRGVSEVVATIILLALTVTLFAAIFAWVNTFPPPPAQNSNQFQASIVTGTNGSSGCTTPACKTVVTSLSVLHLAGPAVTSAASIYIKSANNPLGPEFKAYTLAQGGIPSGKVWNLGQTWTYTFATGLQPVLPDNLTVSIITASQLLFSVILPGQGFVFPPTFLSTYTVPATPTIGQSFTVYAALSGTVTTNSVYVNLGGIPGMSGTSEPMTVGPTGVYSISSSGFGTSSANGTYYAIFNASNSAGQATTSALAITIYPVTSGSSSPTLALSVVQGAVSSSVTATGAAYGATNPIALTFDGSTLTLTSCSSGTLSSGKTSVTPSSGGFSCTFAVPAGNPGGTYTIVAAQLNSGQSAAALFIIVPALTSPTSGSTFAPSSSMTISGTGFSVGGTVAAYFYYEATSGTYTNATVTCASGSLTPTSTGTLSCTYTVPSGVHSGNHSATLSVEDIATGRWVVVSVTTT
jgi:flagellin-like protein